MARRTQAAGRRPRSLAACAPEPGEWADRGPVLPAISPLFSPFSSRSTGRGPCRNRAACDMLSPLLPCTAPLLTASSLPPPASATPVCPAISLRRRLDSVRGPLRRPQLYIQPHTLSRQLILFSLFCTRAVLRLGRSTQRATACPDSPCVCSA
ncbi:hypothetical protein B0J12DRAFT_400083 [Macrophomina phaseolina]|uniref:Uncharacterized protein n=1 Tax=Macrophomina phaseolina TaxID=35725 RepID=A0ABQ8GIA4_9PEZI|nr:hypothetical protein B0J12DRAFT_400083 [Macrophomina phaseolina]